MAGDFCFGECEKVYNFVDAGPHTAEARSRAMWVGLQQFLGMPWLCRGEAYRLANIYDEKRLLDALS